MGSIKSHGMFRARWLAENNEKGFSLAEIAAVVAIVAILMAIAIPAALNQKKKSIEGSQQADLMGAVTGVEKILTGYKGAPPSNIIITTCGNQWTAQTYVTTNPGTSTAWPTGCSGASLAVAAPIASLGAALETGKTTGANIVSGGSNPDGNVTGVPVAIGTNGAYCVQVANTNASNTLRYRSDTRAVETGVCPAISTITGVGTVPTGVAANTPPAPNNITAVSPSDNTVNVSWEAVSGASGYTVSVGGVTKDVPSGSTLTTTLTGVPGGAQTAMVRARNGSGAGAPKTVSVTVTGAAQLMTSLSVPNLYVPPGTGNGAILGGTQYVATEYNGGDTATTNTPGYLIKTKIPFTGSAGNAYPTVEIVGYAYGGAPGNSTTSQTVRLQLGWYVTGAETGGVNCQSNPGGSMCFTRAVYTNSGSWNPGAITLVKLADGNVGIHLQNMSQAMRFTVIATAAQNGNAVTSAWLQGWTVDNTTGVAGVDALKSVTVTSQPVYGATGPAGPAGPAYTPSAVAWTNIGAAGQPAFENSWVNWTGVACGSGSGYNCAGFTKTADGAVMLRGLVQNTGTPTTVMFTLPVGYRPLQQNTFTVLASGQNARINVFPNGQVQVMNYWTGATAAYLSLDGVSFTTS